MNPFPDHTFASIERGTCSPSFLWHLHILLYPLPTVSDRALLHSECPSPGLTDVTCVREVGHPVSRTLRGTRPPTEASSSVQVGSV